MVLSLHLIMLAQIDFIIVGISIWLAPHSDLHRSFDRFAWCILLCEVMTFVAYHPLIYALTLSRLHIPLENSTSHLYQWAYRVKPVILRRFHRALSCIVIQV